MSRGELAYRKRTGGRRPESRCRSASLRIANVDLLFHVEKSASRETPGSGHEASRRRAEERIARRDTLGVRGIRRGNPRHRRAAGEAHPSRERRRGARPPDVGVDVDSWRSRNLLDRSGERYRTSPDQDSLISIFCFATSSEIFPSANARRSDIFARTTSRRRSCFLKYAARRSDAWTSSHSLSGRLESRSE